MRVFAWHRAYHAVVSEKIAREISGRTNKDRDTIRKVLCRMENIFDDCPEIRNHAGDVPVTVNPASPVHFPLIV